MLSTAACSADTAPSPIPTPKIESIAPAHIVLGSTGVVLRITGTGFVPATHVVIDGSIATTRFVSTTEVDSPLPDGLLAFSGVHQVSATNPAPGGASTTLFLSVDEAAPFISSLGASSAQAGTDGVVVTVNGSNFQDRTVVRFNGAARATTHVSSTTLSAQLLAGDLRDPGSFSISVYTPPPGGGESNQFPFTVTAGVPGQLRLPSAGIVAGLPNAVVALDGFAFVRGSVVTVDGQDRPTTYGSSRRLTVALSQTDLITPRVLNLSVRNPGVSVQPDPVSLTVHSPPIASIGSVIKMPGEATDALYDSARARLYLPMHSGPYTGNLIAVDPQTGRVLASLPVYEPGSIAMTDDGAYLYMVSGPPWAGTQSQIWRVSLATFTADLKFTVSLAVSDVETVPGSPSSVVTASADRVRVWDNGVMRGSESIATMGITTITRGPDAATIYGRVDDSSNGFVTLSLGSGGVQIVSTVNSMPPGRAVAYAAGRFYASGVSLGSSASPTFGLAAIIDPEGVPTVVGRFQGFGAEMLPDPALGRLYLLNSRTLTAYDLSTSTSLGSVIVDPSAPNFTLDLTPGRIAKWGTDGLVVREESSVYIFRTGLAAP